MKKSSVKFKATEERESLRAIEKRVRDLMRAREWEGLHDDELRKALAREGDDGVVSPSSFKKTITTLGIPFLKKEVEVITATHIS